MFSHVSANYFYAQKFSSFGNIENLWCIHGLLWCVCSKYLYGQKILSIGGNNENLLCRHGLFLYVVANHHFHQMLLNIDRIGNLWLLHGTTHSKSYLPSWTIFMCSFKSAIWQNFGEHLSQIKSFIFSKYYFCRTSVSILHIQNLLFLRGLF